jgi:hypothetical protein
MASDGNPGNIPAASVVQGSQAATSNSLPTRGGTPLPTSGKIEPAAKTPVLPTSDPAALVRNLNKFLNDSGRPDQFRLDPASGGKLIQQINPASGAVIGEFSATEFPALARSVGVAGLLIDSLA